MESVDVIDYSILEERLCVLEKIGKWTSTLKLRHEFAMVGRRATVEVLKDVSLSKIDIPGLGELRDVLVRTAFLVETDPTGWPPKPMMPITALQRIKESTTNRLDVDKVLLLERESKKLNRLVNTHKRVILLLRKMKMEKWETYNIQKEKELRAKISEISVELVENITALLEERVSVILADLQKMARDFNSSRSKMLSKLLEETDIKILARQVLLPTQWEYAFPQLEKFTDKTGDCLPAPIFLKPLKSVKRYDDGDHERTPLLVNDFDENIAEHDQTSAYFRVLRNSSNSSKAFLKLRIGQTIKQKFLDTEGKVAFGWRRLFKFGPKTFGDQNKLPEITDNLVSDCILKLKNNKAPDEFGIASEHLKLAASDAAPIIRTIITKILTNEVIPEQLKVGIITPVYKNKGNPKEPDNYRRITVTSIVGKILEMVMVKPVKDIREQTLNPLQRGFCRNAGSTNTAFLLSEAIAESKDLGTKLYTTFLDASKAFDVVWHPSMLNKLYDLGVTGKLWNLYHDLYDGLSSRVKSSGLLSRSIPEQQGVRQGGISSTELFKGRCDQLLNNLSDSGFGFSIGAINCCAPTCADDVALLATTAADLQAMISVAVTDANKERYEFNAKKSKAMVMNDNIRADCWNEIGLWTLGGSSISVSSGNCQNSRL
ncbi:hypothetical protein ScPMuIL_017296 [Solemya velum]